MDRRRFFTLVLVALGIVAPPATVLAVYGDMVWRVENAAERGIAPAVFPHWAHRIRYKCYACHPVPFEMQAGANAITMDRIQAGELCGQCHNGETAWGVGFDTCNRCHYGE